MAKIGYFNAVLSDAGVPIQATITVYQAGTQTLASIYADTAGTIVKDNPFQTDVLGRFEFFAATGNYDIQISGSGITTYTISNQPIGVIVTGIDASAIANGVVSNTEFQYLDGLTSAIQSQINGKAPAIFKTTLDAINGLVAVDGAGNYSAKVIGTDVPAKTHASQHASGGTDIVDVSGLAFAKLTVTANINAKNTGPTLIYTVPSGKLLIPLWLVIQVTAFISGSKTIQAVIQAGGNSSTYNDLFASSTITISANNQYSRAGTAAPTPMYGGGSGIYINITTGSNATTENWSVFLVALLV